MLLLEGDIAVIVNGNLCHGHVVKFLVNGLVDDGINWCFVVISVVFVSYELIGGIIDGG